MAVLQPKFLTDYCNNENIIIPEMKKKRHEFNKNINNIQAIFRKQRLRETLGSTILPSKLNGINDYAKGLTEIFFYKKLVKLFPNKILINYAIQLSSSRPYLPDFIYYDKEINLLIDVEIDEPYIASNKTPIHYKESEDFIRDEFFLNKKWSVIRFAEEQIVKYPDECCKLIEKVIFSILNVENIDCDFKNDLKIDIVKLWTFEESNELAKSNYREGYLKNINFF